MNEKIENLQNIGPVISALLNKSDIKTVSELKKVGSKKAFLKIKKVDKTACLSMLNGLEGAICGIRWHQLAPKRRKELKEFFESVK